MNWLRARLTIAPVALVALGTSACAGIPSGPGGFVWASATPQANNLLAVSAPLPGTGGVGLAAAGDASTLIYRRAPLGVGAAGWLCGRGRSVRMDVQYRGVAALAEPARLAICTDDGAILVGDGCLMTTVPLTQQPLNAVAWSTDGTSRRLAVGGEAGAVFTYDDGTGKVSPSEVDPKAGVPATFRSIAFPQGGPVGFAAGDVPSSQGGTMGVLFRTVNGGQSWGYLPSSPGVDTFRGVSFATPLLGFALGSAGGAGIVFRTDDGGASWEPLATVDGSMRSVAAFDAQHIVLVGGSGILASEDGRTFVPRPEPVEGLTVPIPLAAVDVSKSEAWAVGAGGVIFTSSDFGGKWSVFADVPILSQTSLQDYFALRYLSDKVVLAAGTNGALLQSQDAGASFQPIAGVSGETLFGLGSPGARNAGMGVDSTGPVLAVGTRRTIARVDPATGRSLLLGGVPGVDYLAVTTFGGNGVSAWAVGRNGTIVYSAADSPVWSLQQSGVTSSLNAVQAVGAATSPFNVMAAGDGGVVLRSLDGLHWGPMINGGPVTPLPPPFTGLNLHGVAFRNPGVGFVAGDGGLVAGTLDGGRSWLPQQPVPSAAMLAVSTLPDALETWAVGEHQAVLRSLNDGQTWETLAPPVPGTPGTPPPDFAYRTVQVVGPGVAYIAGDQGHLLRTVNGGASWVELGSGGGTYRALRMVSPQAGIAAISRADGPASVLLTSDGWQSAQTAALPSPPAIIFGVDRVNDAAIAVGGGGYIARSLSATAPAPVFGSESGDVRSVASPAVGQYVAVGDGALLMRSADNGDTWRQVPFPNPYGPDLQLKAIAFALPDATGAVPGLAAGGVPGGGVPVLLQTLDGGQSWQPISLDFGADGATINAIGMFSNMALAAAANGAVYLFDGKAWSVQRPVAGFAGSWNAVSATDGRWYLAGDSGMAARYPDDLGAPRWLPLNTGTKNHLYSVCGPPYPSGTGGFGAGGIESLRDDIRGYCGDPGTILITETGGLPLLGNVTRSGAISAADVRSILAVASGLAVPTPDVYFYGDVAPPSPAPQGLPGDGVLDLSDAATVMRAALGL